MVCISIEQLYIKCTGKMYISKNNKIKMKKLKNIEKTVKVYLINLFKVST